MTLTSANVSKANAVSDFYDTGSGTGGAVYSSWDFTNIWVETNTYPILRFNWTGLLTFRQLEELRIGLPFELTGQDHNNAEIIVFEHQTGEDQNNIYGSGIGHLQEADHAVQQPWGVELESL